MISVPVLSLYAAGCYLLGAFPTGYLVFRAREKKDIRAFGSGATGATNVFRHGGVWAALPVALADILKGFAPVFLAARLSTPSVFPALCASAAVLGHCYPAYIGFRGGKGVATGGGAMFALAPLPAFVSLIILVLVAGITRYISLGSVLAASAFPFVLLLFGFPTGFVLATLPLIVIILVRHAGNLSRLVRGTERKFGDRKDIQP